MKGQSEIIAVILIVLISISLIAAAYSWGLPLIQKRQDKSKVDRISSYFDPSNSNSLPNVIETVANNGGRYSFSIHDSGLWQLHPYTENSEYNNSIEFSFFSKISNVAPDVGWISLIEGENCPPSPGILGSSSSYVVCERADKTYDGYNIRYIVFFRKLNQPNSGNSYEIILDKPPEGSINSTSENIEIINGGLNISTLDGEKIIKTKINILLP